jgi:hypothetical protein
VEGIGLLRNDKQKNEFQDRYNKPDSAIPPILISVF